MRKKLTTQQVKKKYAATARTYWDKSNFLHFYNFPLRATGGWKSKRLLTFKKLIVNVISF